MKPFLKYSAQKFLFRQVLDYEGCRKGMENLPPTERKGQGRLPSGEESGPVPPNEALLNEDLVDRISRPHNHHRE